MNASEQHHRVLPGDIVKVLKSHQDGSCASAYIVYDNPPPINARNSFLSEHDALMLQREWRSRMFIDQYAVYFVVCASNVRSMVMHSSGKLLIIENKFLNVIR